MSARILICGDRHWHQTANFDRVIDQLIGRFGEDLSIIAGGAPGVDTLAAAAAIKRSLVTVIVPAKWHIYDKTAGPIRNKYMLEKCKPHIVLGFHPNPDESRGTKNMINLAKQAGVQFYFVRSVEEFLWLLPQLPEKLPCQNPALAPSRQLV